jgi:GNAT superfamily N-acetyltransferase
VDPGRLVHHAVKRATSRRSSATGSAVPAPVASARARGVAPSNGPETRIVEADPAQHYAMLAFLASLSPQTAYRRFITSADPTNVVDVPRMLINDPCQRAVVALAGQEIVSHGLASPEDGSVELAVVVADQWQGNRIGTRLVRALLETGPAQRPPSWSSSYSTGMRRLRA